MIGSILIANRGEIACRVIRTARRMGVRTVAVYSDADAGALHVRQADEAVRIGPAAAAESYLRGDAIIAAARASGAEAIHPGYGFLSENADFAQAVIEAGLIWIGPDPAAIRAMGLKDAAKALMAKAGVPVTPGYLGDDQSPARLEQEALAIGFPVLIKAVAGGGGKGMRRVDGPELFATELAACRREAMASFGNDRVLIEKYIASPRHIEVQVFGDRHGNVVHLFERDCSLQRRHQKVIEEAPAPGMDDTTRSALCGAAVRAAEAVNYVGAGTVEFIADGSGPLDAERIWFMEMNTRLQVEHPVTEAITGVDLVEWQLRVASGEPLPLQQDQLAIDGWAMEARLYAEDPAKGFLPVTGTLEHFALPGAIRPTRYLDPVGGNPLELGVEASARIETGVSEGDAISPWYDPMIAKLVCHAANRHEAARGLNKMCWDTVTWPLQTNATFLGTLAVHPDFLEQRLDTGFIERHLGDLAYAQEPPRWLLNQVAARLARRHAGCSPALQGFRLNAPPQTQVSMVDRDAPYHGDAQARVTYEQVHYPLLQDTPEGVLATLSGATWHFTPMRKNAMLAAGSGSGTVLAPMPGKVIAIDVHEGQTVERGQPLLTLEAMKMEHRLTAPFDGTVADLSVRAGQQVALEAVLVRIVSDEAA